MEQWRIKTYAAIRAAYDRRVKEYEEALAAEAVVAGIEMPEMSAGERRTTLEHELRKSCISAVTGQHFDGFDGVENDSGGRPQLRFSYLNGQGPYARFFEQAFEWEHMQYVFYPYYWSRKETWRDKVTLKNGDDPTFAEFLRAGSARIVVPARPGFGPDIEHFLRSGDPWGGDGVHIGDPSYLSIVDEIRARTDVNIGNPEPVGEPWSVRVPTSLILINPKDALPRWVQGEDGEWVPG
jgi:hypothetical protein